MKKFGTSLYGYNKQDVNIFVKEVAKEYESMLNNLKEVNDENKRLLEQIEKYKEMQGSFNKAILVAEDASNQIKKLAKDEYRQIVDEAKKNASRIVNEALIRADKIEFLGKALKPLPEKFHGLEDIETIYRNRYIDLITNDESKKKFLLRSKFIRELRNFLDEKGYIEIETPILNNKASGATAKPFITHHNALDIDLYLRIAPETYLKRAVVGGFTKVFEIARCFRNEGMDATHLQDFTMIEGYGAYLNYKDNMIFLQNLLQTTIEKTFGTLNITIGDKDIDLSGNWPVVSFRELLLKYSDIDINIYNTKELLLNKIKENKIEIESETPLENLGYGNLVDQLYKKVARPYLVNPVFLVEHPISLSPLARANDENPNITDRFQLVINGAEIINAYSELVDPIEQERRLLKQAELKAAGDEEAMCMDYDYIDAMEYGMPPISGWGMGIDRLMQLLTNSDNIKDCILFPLMKPLNKDN